MTGGKDLVLVTGGSGFLGGYIVLQLLQKGYSVRTTVRTPSRVEEARAKLKHGGATSDQLTNQLEIIVLDLITSTDPEWSKACEGAKYAMHTAGMIATGKEKTLEELVTPLKEGTLRVLQASAQAGVQKFIFTSSVAAIAHGHGMQRDKSQPFTEEDWTDLTDSKEKLHIYPRAKTLQEQAVWEFVKEHNETAERKMELAVVCPAAIYGPTLSKEFASSLKLVPILLGGMPGVPQYGTSMVDVRDCADLHIKALENEKANGQRYLAISGRAEEVTSENGVCNFVDIITCAEILRNGLAADKTKKIPTRKLPNFVMRAAGYFDPVVGVCLPDLGKELAGSFQKARRELEWEPSKTIDESLLDSARSLIEFEAV
ncbi:Tetraketide alpha-pyrone reductase 2 [Pseudocercospora fuligena]|uniref:Tetraketide alpha-pyrone reductase 2 n=1 Tax=Pseudocercospora fuligena TaxID=685502 RepID=A0A8H6RJW9_9PEZI|nr:Tetraketide alpha-pyrone reductase 2 [Pseudocercospora fuligena]